MVKNDTDERRTNEMKDLTEGKPLYVLWNFSIPMFISVIFQQLYNIADSVIAGKFAGEDALAAVGASYPITMIFMAIAIGSNIGCAVVISQLYGAKQYGMMKTAIFTTLVASAGLSILLMGAGLMGTRSLMEMIRTPSNIFEEGAVYLRIYIAGFLFLYLYNVGTGIFTSLGDSKTPLYFLIGSSLGNIVLDYLFVAVFQWGVPGVAWATFLAQGIACVFALWTLNKKIRNIHGEGTVLFSWNMLKKIGAIAVPSILQQSFVSIGNIFIQSLINGFGSSVIAGYSAAIKLNTFAITSFTTLGNGISSFTAQNLGAGKLKRIKEGLRAGMGIGVLAALPFLVCFFGFGGQMMGLFLKDESAQAMKTGVEFLRIVSPFYLVISIKLAADGVLRGTGRMRMFMLSTFTDLILRVILAYLFAYFGGVTAVWLSWPIGWTIAMVLSGGFAWKVIREYSSL